MQSLSDLCLNKIEDSGADTRELAQVELPKQMWTRHPVYSIICTSHCGDTMDYDGNRFELCEIIEVSFTGVYTLKLMIEIINENGEHVVGECFESILKEYGLTQYEKTFECLEGEISKDELEYLHGLVDGSFHDFVRMAQENLIAYEIAKIILDDTYLWSVEASFKGKVNFNFFGPWGGGNTDYQMLKDIAEKINLIRYI